MVPSTLLLALVLAVLGGATSAEDVVCTSDFENIVSEDCRTLYRCVWKKPVKMPDCAPGLIFSRQYSVCVREGSEFDDCAVELGTKSTCTSKPCKHGGNCKPSDDGKSYTCACPAEYGGVNCEKALTIQEICNTELYYRAAHPQQCQLYYDCATNTSSYYDQHVRECKYPQLFSEQTLQCENYTEVECGDRTEHKSPCDYLSHQCRGSHCQPCALNYPSCEGKEDGAHPHGYKIESPWFMVCKDERFISDGLCPGDSTLHVHSKIYNGECTSVYGIPKDQGGIMPDCSGQADGNYKDQSKNPSIYYTCNGGETTVKMCPTGQVFDETEKACIEK